MVQWGLNCDTTVFNTKDTMGYPLACFWEEFIKSQIFHILQLFSTYEPSLQLTIALTLKSSLIIFDFHHFQSSHLSMTYIGFRWWNPCGRFWPSRCSHHYALVLTSIIQNIHVLWFCRIRIYCQSSLYHFMPTPHAPRYNEAVCSDVHNIIIHCRCSCY